MDARRFLEIVFKHRYRMAAIFLSVFGSIALATFLVSPVFEAHSSLLVKFGREHTSHSELSDSNSFPSLNSSEILNSEIQILTHRDLIEDIVRDMGIETLYPDIMKSPPGDMTPMEAAILEFQENLFASDIKDSKVIKVAFRHENKEVAAQAVNLLVDGFKAKHLRVFSNPPSSFLRDKLDISHAKLINSEKLLEDFKQNKSIYSIAEEKSLLINQRDDLEIQKKKSGNRIKELREVISTLRQKMDSFSSNEALYTDSERDKIIVEAEGKLLSLRLQKQQLLKTYKESSRFVQDIQNEIALVESFLKRQENAIGRKVRTGNTLVREAELEMMRAEADYGSQNAKFAALKGQIEDLDKKISRIDSYEKDLRDLEREREIQEENYRTYLKRYEEALITDDMNRRNLTNISVIQRAVAPPEPLKPKKLLNLLLGSVLGMFSAVCFVFFSERVSGVFADGDAVEEHLGIPVLVSIPFKENT